MKNCPLVTIGILSYNAIDTIRMAIYSAINQDYENLEIIVVDDCSTDKTYDELLSIKEEYSVIKLHRNKRNMGVAYSRNEVIKKASGEFVAFFDDDDISKPQRISKQVDLILSYEKKHKVATICHTARTKIYADGTKCYIPTIVCEGEDVNNGKELIKAVLFGLKSKVTPASCATCSQISRKYVYQALGGFDQTLRRSEDTDLNIRAAMNCVHFLGIAEPLVIQKDTECIEKTLESEFYYYIKVLTKYRQEFDLTHRNLFDFTMAWTNFKKAYLSKKYGLMSVKIIQLTLRYPLFTINKMTSMLFVRKASLCRK